MPRHDNATPPGAEPGPESLSPKPAPDTPAGRPPAGAGLLWGCPPWLLGQPNAPLAGVIAARLNRMPVE